MTADENHPPIIHTQADLEDAWRNLMEPLGFARRTLWLMFVDPDDRLLPQVVEIHDLPPVLDAEDRLGLQRLLEESAGSGLRPAFLITLPGAGFPTVEDRRCAGQLVEACRAAGVVAEVVHVATDTELVPVPMDDLPLPASA
jgi:hypothetical protein